VKIRGSTRAPVPVIRRSRRRTVPRERPRHTLGVRQKRLGSRVTPARGFMSNGRSVVHHQVGRSSPSWEVRTARSPTTGSRSGSSLPGVPLDDPLDVVIERWIRPPGSGRSSRSRIVQVLARPIPDSISSLGVSIAPALRITPRAAPSPIRASGGPGSVLDRARRPSSSAPGLAQQPSGSRVRAGAE